LTTISIPVFASFNPLATCANSAPTTSAPSFSPLNDFKPAFIQGLLTGANEPVYSYDPVGRSLALNWFATNFLQAT
jgi:hypothetical protein